MAAATVATAHGWRGVMAPAAIWTGSRAERAKGRAVVTVRRAVVTRRHVRPRRGVYARPRVHARRVVMTRAVVARDIAARVVTVMPAVDVQRIRDRTAD